MNVQKQWKRLLIGGAAALTLTAGTLWAVDHVSAASPATLSNTLWQQTGLQQMAEFGGRGGHGGHGGRGGHGGPGMERGHGMLGAHEQYLADALDITLEELQTAQESVRNTLIDQAVADGTITQEQADAIKAGERVRVPGLRMKGDMEGVDHEALLANALGVTVEQLEAAKTTARETAIADALANGEITQEQVDRMAAHQAFRSYVEETYGTERPDATMAELIQEAVDADAITQEQAGLLASGKMERMGPGGRGGFKGRGPRDGGIPSDVTPNESAPGTIPNSDDNSGVEDGNA